MPKILAPIRDRAFWDYFLEWLSGQGATRVVLCLGYLAEAVREHLAANGTYGLEITITVESRPLGTGGTVALADQHLKSDPVIVMNGDTFVDMNLMEFLQVHLGSGANASIVCAWVEQASRYGRVEIDRDDYVLRFVEKDILAGPSWIRAGIYLFNRLFHLQRIEGYCCGSLERDLLRVSPPGAIRAFKSKGIFLDIGTSESLAQASTVFAKQYNLGTNLI